MKKCILERLALVSFILLAFVNSANSQATCNRVVFTNDFSSVTGWTTVTTGSANISSGQFNLVNAYGSAYNKTYYSLGTSISNTYFKAECKYTITSSNPTGNGVGTLIMGLTAGTLDFYSYDASSSFAATSQDAIGVDINSPSASDNNVNDWQIFIASKRGALLHLHRQLWQVLPSVPIIFVLKE